MEKICILFYRLIGPIMLIAAVAVFKVNTNSMTKLLALTKHSSENEVLQESNLATQNEFEISRDEMMAIMIAGPNKNVTIKDSTSGYTIKVKAGDGTVAYVKVTDLSGATRTIYFGKDRWDTSKLNLENWLTSNRYQGTTVEYSTGTVRRIFYKGVN